MMATQRIQAVVEVEAHDEHVVRQIKEILLDRLSNSPRIDNPDFINDLYLVVECGHDHVAAESLRITFDLFVHANPIELATKLVAKICDQISAEQSVTVRSVPECFHVMQPIAA